MANSLPLLVGILQRSNTRLKVLDELLSLFLAQWTYHAFLDCSDCPVAGVHQPASFRREVRAQPDDLLKEILLLTKLNWNSARLGGLLPITLRFSQRVGDTLKELPPTVDPLPQAKYYM